MWKCIRCEKENKDTAEICAECGHGRTMDYMHHRTLTKISAKRAKNWKISRNNEKKIKKLNDENQKKIQNLKKEYRQMQQKTKGEASKGNLNENRKNAEEVIRKKLSSLRSSVTFLKDEISKEQDEINTLHGTIEERTKLIDKDAKANKIITIIAWIIAIALSVFIAYIFVREAFAEESFEQFCLRNPNGGLDTTNVAVLLVVAFIMLLLIFGMLQGYAIIELLIGRFIRTVSDETLKQAKTERDNAKKSIDEKKNEINSIYQKISSLEKQISKIESSKSSLTDNLSRVFPEHMSKELERWIR